MTTIASGIAKEVVDWRMSQGMSLRSRGLGLGGLLERGLVRLPGAASVSTTAARLETRAGKHYPTRHRTNPLTYDMAYKPWHIGVYKSWLSWHSGPSPSRSPSRITIGGLEGDLEETRDKSYSRAAKFLLEDFLIRKFMMGTWHGCLPTELVCFPFPPSSLSLSPSGMEAPVGDKAEREPPPHLRLRQPEPPSAQDLLAHRIHGGAPQVPTPLFPSQHRNAALLVPVASSNSPSASSFKHSPKKRMPSSFTSDCGVLRCSGCADPSKLFDSPRKEPSRSS